MPRRWRPLAGLTAAIVGFGILSSSIGSGALPASTLPVFGVTNGEGSRMAVAELGDINGDGIGDYAVGRPSADVGGSVDAGVVYVFLGRSGALPATPTAVNLGSASFTISGHAGEMLGFAIAGDDLNRDGLNDIAIGAPAAGAPSKDGGGAVYVIFGSRNPGNVSTASLYADGRLTNDPLNPAPPSPIGSRYDGFVVGSHTGFSLAALPDVNGDRDLTGATGYRDLAVGAPDGALHIDGGGGLAVIYGKPQGQHITFNDLWDGGYPYWFHADYPARDGSLNQHLGESVAFVGDVTGDGWPDLAVGAPQADFNGRADSGSVWIISRHLPPIDAGCTGMLVDNSCPWIRLWQMDAAQAYRIDGAQAGDGLGSSLAGAGDQNNDGIPDIAIGASAASPAGRSGAGEVVVVPGQRGVAERDLAASPPLQRVYGAEAGSGLGASLSAAGDVDGDGHVDLFMGAPGESSFAGAAYLLRGVAGATSDLANAAAKIAPAGAGAQVGSSVAAGFSLDGSGADSLVSAPGANGGAGGAFVVGGTGTPILPVGSRPCLPRSPRRRRARRPRPAERARRPRPPRRPNRRSRRRRRKRTCPSARSRSPSRGTTSSRASA